MISINASYTNLVNQRTLATNTNALHKATERLATGMRVNHANDDAAALFVGSALSSSLSGMKIALDNTMLASNFLNIADGALSNVSDNLMRMNQLATQACNGFMSTEARQTLQAELDQMKANITQTIGKADMNGVSTVKKTGMSADLMVEIDVQTEEQLKKAGYVECTAENLADEDNTLFYINSAEQLQTLRVHTNGGGTTTGRTFTLSEDIDLSSVCSKEKGDWTTIGTAGKAFNGIFDGNGHIISNLYIESGTSHLGLFASTNGATIQNLGVENVDISLTICGGGLIGWASSTTISNVYTTGKINGTNTIGGLIGNTSSVNASNVYSTVNVEGNSRVGGLIGYNADSAITNAFATGNVVSTIGDDYGNAYAGGLVAINNNSTINNSFATGNVASSKAQTGGLVGYEASSSISNCFATGNVSGGSNVGGLIGRSITSDSINNSFSTGNVSGTNNVGLLVGYGITNTGTGNYYSTDSLLNGNTGGNAIGVGAAQWANAPIGTSFANLKSTIDWNSWDTDIWDLSGDMPTFKKRSTAILPTTENIAFQISDGYDANSSIDYDCALNLNLGNLDLSNEDNARRTLTKIQDLLTQVTEKQSYIGTQLNRLTNIATASQMTIENYSAARSTILDTDIAQEVANMTKSQILQQISVSVLSQSKNVEGQIALQLLG